MPKIIGKFKGEIDVKRLYMPGLVIETDCPSCGVEIRRDYKDLYLSYPVANEPFGLHAYCPDCNKEWEIPAILEVKLKLIKES